MRLRESVWGGFLVTSSSFVFSLMAVVKGDPLVPSLCIFGDSVVDAGNNNFLNTLIKANFPPYGRDFANHTPTGRFSNGKLATDFTAEFLGFTSYPPAYLSQEANNGNNILGGANFASAASGYYDRTPQLYHAITLEQQLGYYKEWMNRVVSLAGRDKGKTVISDGIQVVSAGTSDFIQNYYINPMLNRAYTPDQFSNLLIRSYTRFIQSLYGLGARRIGVTNLPPTGCLPASITLFGAASNGCIERMNEDAVSFNTKLKRFFESRRACCGTGTVETSYFCNARSIGTCSNATGYVFWDGFHPSQAANLILAQTLLSQGLDLIS
ncbi:hypothetical protein DM860_010391 [Cuscuta australis]|uniref:Uncharacterized protein n=1 Tax=Cuscuta australis TaxID=267555 RepID=A0A328E5E0_9ASTE|nr:hypothetical protein DM860_010391 [Cuscuta australis]